MSISIGVVMDPIGAINFKKDTTLALLLAAQERGWSLVYMELCDLMLRDGVAVARQRALKVYDDANRWYELGEVLSKEPT